MWLIEYLQSGFTQELPIIQLDVFRVIFGVSLLMKYWTEHTRGYFHYFKPHTYLYFTYRAKKTRIPISKKLYQGLYCLKIPAALGVAMGLWPQACLVILLAALFLEMRIFFKYHTNYFFLMGLCLLCSSTLGHTLNLIHYLNDPTPWLHQVWADVMATGQIDVQPFMIMVLLVMYNATAVRKLNPHFLQGSVVHNSILVAGHTSGRRQHRDWWLGESFIHRLTAGTPEDIQKRWQPWMVATVVLELVLPYMLLWEPTFGLACLLGAAMHAGFTILFPATLLHFSIITVATYLLYWNPILFQQWLASLIGGLL